MPLSFGPHGGQILVADENTRYPVLSTQSRTVHQIPALHRYFIISSITSVRKPSCVIPEPPCTFCSGGAFFQAIKTTNTGLPISAGRLHRVGWHASSLRASNGVGTALVQ